MDKRPNARRTSTFALLFASAVAVCGPAFAADAGEDKMITTASTPDVVAKGLETDGYSLGVLAYTWGYPLVRMERVARSYTDVPSPKPATSYRAALDKIGWATELATPDAKDMPTANNDTYYMSAVVKLDQPYILSVPDTHDRYYVVNVFNMWQELEHYIGRRTTGTTAARYVIVPPKWSGKLPDGVVRLDVTTDKVWLWGRLHVEQGEPVDPVHALQAEFKLEPLDGKPVANETLPPMPSIEGDEFGFLKQLAFALKSNPVKPADEALFAQFARIGLTADGFDPSKLSAETKKGLSRGLADGVDVALASIASTAQIKNGWQWATGLDRFGFNYPLRALVSGPYLGGNGEKEAMYPTRYTDSAGAPLVGANKYVVHFAKEPPVGAFWSLTMYDASDKMLVENPISRYKIGSDTKGLQRNADGSFVVSIQAEPPADKSNWLPAPKGGFYVILRMYQPSEAVLDGEYQLPQVEKQ
jgi:hypothetical protein